MDSKFKQVFLELLRCGMEDIRPNSQLFTGLTPQDWNEVFRTVGKQTVIGVCFQAVRKLPPGFRPPQAILLPWMGQSLYIEAQSHKMLQVWQELQRRFTEAGIHPLLMKGLAVASCYARPASRQAGDIDLFVPEKYQEALRLVHQWNCETQHLPQHDSFDYQGIHIEMHPELISVPFKPRTGCRPVAVYWNDTELPTPDVHSTCLLLLSHAAKHFLVRGVGYRHLCDWAVFLQRFHSEIDTDLVLRETRRMGMYRFAVEFTAVAHRELHLSFPGLEKWLKDSREKYVRILIDSLETSGDIAMVNRTIGTLSLSQKIKFVKKAMARKPFWPQLFWKELYINVYPSMKRRFIRCTMFWKRKS